MNKKYVLGFITVCLVSCGGTFFSNQKPLTEPVLTCSVSKVGSTSIITCPDGTSTTIEDGQTGTTGSPGQSIVGPQGVQGAAGLNGTNGYSSLIEQTIASVAMCPNGGTVLTMGLDTNNDGTLEVSEVNQSATLCNGINATGNAGLDGTNGSNGGTVTFNLVQAIEPCGAASSPWKETLLALAGGQVLGDFSETSSGQDTRLSFIPNGSYVDTDESGCSFTVSGDGVSNSEISWSAGSNSYSTWIAGGFSWTPVTGWVANP